MYSPLVRRGRIIAFHDIVEHPLETVCEVSSGMRSSIDIDIEIVKDWNQKWAGIGVIVKE